MKRANWKVEWRVLAEEAFTEGERLCTSVDDARTTADFLLGLHARHLSTLPPLSSLTIKIWALYTSEGRWVEILAVARS